MMTRPYLGYVTHPITLISISFRLPFPIEKYNNDSWENVPSWRNAANFFRFLFAPFLNSVSRTNELLGCRRLHLPRPMAIHNTPQPLPSLCPNSNHSSSHTSHNNRNSRSNSRSNSNSSTLHLDQRALRAVTDGTRPI